jgi:uncharacterized damage-inducible protein DinB
MSDLQTVITDDRRAVTDFLATARAVPPAAWHQPRAPGKWSPAQVTEHVAIAYEVSRGILRGTFAWRGAPRFVRPLIRTFFLKPVLKTGRFAKGGKTPTHFEPTTTPASIGDLATRLQAAATAFEVDVQAAAQGGQTTLDHPFFGAVPLAEYLRLQVIHTSHHRQQLPPPTT